MVLVALAAEGIATALRTAVIADRHSAVSAFGYGRLTAWHTCVSTTGYVLDLAVGNHSRRSILRQFSKQYTDAFTGQFEFLNLLGSRIALFVKLRL